MHWREFPQEILNVRETKLNIGHQFGHVAIRCLFHKPSDDKVQANNSRFMHQQTTEWFTREIPNVDEAKPNDREWLSHMAAKCLRYKIAGQEMTKSKSITRIPYIDN